MSPVIVSPAIPPSVLDLGVADLGSVAVAVFLIVGAVAVFAALAIVVTCVRDENELAQVRRTMAAYERASRGESQ
jgi:hypothetical protein